MNHIRFILQNAPGSYIEQHYKSVEATLDTLAKPDSMDPILYSDESMMSLFMDPRMNLFKTDEHCTNPMEPFFRNLSTFNNSSEKYEIFVVLVLRDQVNLVHSWYAEKYHRFSEREGLETFDGYLKRLLSDEFYLLGGQVFDFDHLYQTVHSHLSESNVCWLSFHELFTKQDPDRLLDFLTLKPNDNLRGVFDQEAVNKRKESKGGRVGSSKGSKSVLKKILRLKKSVLPNLSTGMGNMVPQKKTIIEMSEEQVESIRNFFGPSNERFCRLQHWPDEFLKDKSQSWSEK